VLAFVIIVLGFVALILGKDGDIALMLFMVVGFYFGAKTTLNKEE